jgi:hypothetical protein
MIAKTLLPQAGSPTATQTSLTLRLIDIFVSPGEVFEEVISSPHNAANWLVPILISCLIGVSSLLWLTEEPFFQEKSGIVAEAQRQLGTGIADSDEAKSDHTASLAGARLSGEAAIVGGSFIGTVWSAFVLWFLGRFVLQARFSYLKALEIAALSGIILVLSTVVTTLLVLATENVFAKPALSLLVSNFDPSNKSHQLLSMLDITHVWTTAVLSVGLAKLSKVTFAEAAFWVFAYWWLLRGVLLLLK